MTDDRELMQMALDALANIPQAAVDVMGGEKFIACCIAIEALRARLAQPEQESDAYYRGYQQGKFDAQADAAQGEWVGDKEYWQYSAQPEQEPVAWMHTTATGEVYFRKKPQDKVFNPQPVYTTPSQREWVGLTDEEIRNEANHHVFDESFFNGAIWARGQIMGKNNG